MEQKSRPKAAIKLVELTGFEPATSSSRTKRATSLRYSSLFVVRRSLRLKGGFVQFFLFAAALGCDTVPGL